jgi:protease-4
VLESMTGIYDLFLARVAEGRKIPVEKVAVSAEGRIFSGREGKNRGLVDEIGGLEAAITKARELAKLDADAAVAVVENSPRVLEALGGGSGADEGGDEGRAQHVTEAAKSVLDQVAPDMVPFVSALAPLTGDEHQAAAMPYVLVVK